MFARSDTTDSVSSVALGKKRLTSQNFHLAKHTTQVYITPTSTDIISDHESSNVKYHHKRILQKDIRDYFVPYEMKNARKMNVMRFTGSTSQQPQQNEVPVEPVDFRRSIRTPRWPESHNAVFGDLLLEQMMAGNILSGRVNRQVWGEVVTALNRIVGTTYSESAVITRFKNMKADFRMLYQLSNRSGWGWDEELHLPVATDEIWDEAIKVNPKLARFRRNSFHQYEVFERICGENIAVGTTARSSEPPDQYIETNDTHILDDIEVPMDDFMASNGVSFENFNEEAEQQQMGGASGKSGSKRSSGETRFGRRRAKKRFEGEDIANLVAKNSESARMLVETITKEDPYSMNVCYEKLSTIPNITEEATVAVIDALSLNLDNKMAFLKMEGRILHLWIEKIVSKDSRYYASPVWM